MPIGIAAKSEAFQLGAARLLLEPVFGFRLFLVQTLVQVEPALVALKPADAHVFASAAGPPRGAFKVALFRTILHDRGLARPSPLLVDLVAVFQRVHRISSGPAVTIDIITIATDPLFSPLQPLAIRLAVPIHAIQLEDADLMAGYVADVE